MRYMDAAVHKCMQEQSYAEKLWDLDFACESNTRQTEVEKGDSLQILVGEASFGVSGTKITCRYKVKDDFLQITKRKRQIVLLEMIQERL